MTNQVLGLYVLLDDESQQGRQKPLAKQCFPASRNPCPLNHIIWMKYIGKYNTALNNNIRCQCDFSRNEVKEKLIEKIIRRDCLLKLPIMWREGQSIGFENALEASLGVP